MSVSTYMSKLTYAPLPKWVHIIRAIFNRQLKLPDLAKYWSVGKDKSYWFSRSAWSLYAIVKFRKAVDSRGKVNVWLPDYFCNASIEPIRTLDVEIFFYPVKHDGRPDLAKCNEAIVNFIPDIIVFVHYFGVPTYSHGLYKLARKNNAWLVEDAAHCVAPEQGIGGYGDFVLYSPHKTLAIPDGGVLLIREDGPNKISNNFLIEHGFNELYFSMMNGSPLLNMQSYKWLLKRILQKIGVRYNSKQADFDNDLVATNAGDFCHPKMSTLAIRLLSAMVLDLKKESNNRRNNQHAWRSRLKQGDVIIALRSHKNYTPYLSMCTVSDSASIKNEFIRLQNSGIPVTTWPDLPPEIFKNSKEHKEAIQMRKTRLFLPVHSSINSEKIIENLKGIVD